MKPSKITIAYLVITAAVALFDVALIAIATWVLVGKVNGTMLMPEWFFPLCISGAAINGAYFGFTIVYFILNKK